jgi:acyl-coenzyme A thioesterase PaaI-like protein
MKKIKNPYAGMEEQGYNCFACCPSNPFGLKMEFYEDGDDIVCLWKPHTNFQSWLNTLHGGIQSTLMDEVGGWVVNRKLQTAGQTTHLAMRYRNPVPVGEDVVIEIRGHIKEMKRNFAFIEASLSHDGKVCSTCEMTYFCFPKDVAAEKFFFKGCELEEE